MKNIAIIITTAFLLLFYGCQEESSSGSDTEGNQSGMATTGTAVDTAVTEDGNANRQLPAGGEPTTTDASGNISTASAKEQLKAVGKEKPWYIKGKYINGAGGTITLDRLGIGLQIKPLFSQTVNKDGIFDFEGSTTGPDLMQFRLPHGNIHFIIRPGDTLFFTIEFEHPENFQVEGSLETKHLVKMYDILNEANHKKIAIEDKIKATSDKRELVRLYQEKPEQYRKINEEKVGKLIKFMERIDTSYVALLASMYVQPPDKYIDFLQKLDKKMKPRYEGTLFYNALHDKVLAYSPIAGGSIAPEVLVESPEGKPLRLTNYRGKYVLLDYWASWCVPCRREAPYLREAYNKYKNKGAGFEIFSVSLDDNRNSWLQAIKEDNMSWVNGSELMGFNSASASVYLVSAIPANFLIDPEGRIIAKNLRGAELEKKLSQVIK